MNKILDHLEEWLVASFMALATIIIFVAVLHRYTASIPWVWQFTQHLSLTWAQELCIYLFIWMAKFGAEIVPDAKLTPESPCSWMKQETERWGLVIKSAGVYAD